LTGAI
jgi:hypothetical protein